MESSVKFKVCAAIPAAEVSAVSVEEVSAPLFAAFSPVVAAFPALALSTTFPVLAVLLPAFSATALPSVPAFSAAPLPAVSRIFPVTPSASAPSSEAPARPVSSPAAPSVISSCAASSQPFPATAASSAFSPSESSSSSPVSSICTEFSSWGFSTTGFVPS